jgi:hypothetical protein
MTKVQFLIEKDVPFVFAYFPETDFDIDGIYKSSYSHIGQHSACSHVYANECQRALPSQYRDLLAELQSIGYTKLHVL